MDEPPALRIPVAPELLDHCAAVAVFVRRHIQSAVAVEWGVQDIPVVPATFRKLGVPRQLQANRAPRHSILPAAAPDTVWQRAPAIQMHVARSLRGRL